MICIAKSENIEAINNLGKNLYDNFEKIYPLNNYVNNENYIILIDKEKDINGFLLVYKNLDYYELEIIITAENMRKKGIASMLIEYFIKNYCKKNDIILLEVSDKNEIAISLYKKFEFEIINIRKKYYKDSDAFIMKKVIN